MFYFSWIVVKQEDHERGHWKRRSNPVSKALLSAPGAGAGTPGAEIITISGKDSLNHTMLLCLA